MENYKKYFEINKNLWNQLTEFHLNESETYPIEDFLNGKLTLKPLEIFEMGNVKEKKLLHFLCHFGMDTLSWARLGAEVTGVDISSKAISAANTLSKKTNINAEFICSNLYDIEKKLEGKFDIIFLSYGALYWLPNLDKFSQIVFSYLRSGGFLYIVDGHPIYSWNRYNDNFDDIAKYDYFDRQTQIYNESDNDYANPDKKADSQECGWHYTIGDIINSLAKNGLFIDFFNEFPSFDMIRKDGKFVSAGKENGIPKMFSIKALKK